MPRPLLRSQASLSPVPPAAALPTTNSTMLRLTFVVAFSVAALVATVNDSRVPVLGLAARADEPWSQFRGPAGDGISRAKNLPVKWSETEQVRWKTAIHGKAWSSPVVWGQQIWLTTATADGKKLSALQVDLETGKIARDITLFEIEKPAFCIARNSYASSTPVIEEGRLYAHFGSAGTACVDTATGKTIWARQDLPCDHHRGPASSPIVWGELLILTFDGFDVQYVTALDKTTGKTVWKRDREITYGSDNGDIKKAYATPQIIEIGGVPQLVDPSAGASIAYNPKTGEELWRVQCGGMNVSMRPVASNGLVYLTTADGGFKMFAAKLDGKGDVTNSHVVWKQSKGIPKYSSPVLVGDLLYMSAENGVLTCIQAADGEVVWQERVGGSFTASPIATADRVYFFNEEGEGFVVAAGREFKLISRNKLDKGLMASPVVAGDSLILRTTEHLYRIGG